MINNSSVNSTTPHVTKHNGVMRVGVAEAKNKLTEFLRAVERGERITVCRHGIPIVDLVPTGTPGRRTAVTNRPNWASPAEIERWLRDG